MDLHSLVDQAHGEICLDALQKGQHSSCETGFKQWSPGKSPVEYLRSGEQPHYLWVESGDVLRVSSGRDTDLSERSRISLPQVNEWKNGNGEGCTASVGKESVYPNILLITDQRLLLFVGREYQDDILELGFHETDVDVDLAEGTILADGIQYQFKPLESDPSKLNFILQESDFSRKSVDIDIQIKDASRNTESNRPSSSGTILEQASPKYSSRNASLSKLRALSPREFEHWVAEAWESMGYTCTVTSKGQDSGIDVIAEKDGERTLIQAKRYTDSKVGIATVQRVAGLLVDSQFDASEVAIVTTSEYTDDAIERAEKIDTLMIVDGFELSSIPQS